MQSQAKSASAEDRYHTKGTQVPLPHGVITMPSSTNHEPVKPKESKEEKKGEKETDPDTLFLNRLKNHIQVVYNVSLLTISCDPALPDREQLGRIECKYSVDDKGVEQWVPSPILTDIVPILQKRQDTSVPHQIRVGCSHVSAILSQLAAKDPHPRMFMLYTNKTMKDIVLRVYGWMPTFIRNPSESLSEAWKRALLQVLSLYHPYHDIRMKEGLQSHPGAKLIYTAEQQLTPQTFLSDLWKALQTWSPLFLADRTSFHLAIDFAIERLKTTSASSSSSTTSGAASASTTVSTSSSSTSSTSSTSATSNSDPMGWKVWCSMEPFEMDRLFPVKSVSASSSSESKETKPLTLNKQEVMQSMTALIRRELESTLNCIMEDHAFGEDQPTTTFPIPLTGELTRETLQNIHDSAKKGLQYMSVKNPPVKRTLHQLSQPIFAFFFETTRQTWVLQWVNEKPHQT